VRGRSRLGVDVLDLQRDGPEADRVPGAHHDEVGARRGRGHQAEVLDGGDEVEGVVGVEVGVRRQRADLALQVEQAGQVADGRRHRLPAVGIGRRHRDGQSVGQDHRQPAVVVAVGQLGVAEVDLADVDEEREVLHGREDLVDDGLGDGQVVTSRAVGVLRVRKRAARMGRNPATAGRRSASPSAITTRASQGRGSWRRAGLPDALPRQGPPLQGDLAGGYRSRPRPSPGKVERIWSGGIV
jgi:nucleoid DNA-binding protein